MAHSILSLGCSNVAKNVNNRVLIGKDLLGVALSTHLCCEILECRVGRKFMICAGHNLQYQTINPFTALGGGGGLSASEIHCSFPPYITYILKC